MSRHKLRKSLLLAAFFEEHEVRNMLVSKGVHTPSETDELIAAWGRGRKLFESAPPWADMERVVIEKLPDCLSAVATEIRRLDMFRAVVQDLPHEIAVVSLGELVAFQFTIDRPYSASYRVPDEPSLEAIAEITLPRTAPAFPVNVSADPGGVTVSAPGPNLRIAGMGVEPTPAGLPKLTLELTFGTPFVQVAEFQGRMILRDGYHRAVSLLSQGVTHAPVIVLRCTDYAQTGGLGGFFFAPRIVMGPKPPLVKHYLSPYAVEFNAIDYHKAIRFRPDEFQLPVPE